MSDEALNKHLDWLDECVEEQGEEDKTGYCTEHVHEWVVGVTHATFAPYAFCRETDAELDQHEIASRLNEYERLKKATEEFVGFMDEYYSIKGKVEPLKSDIDEDRILKAIYADILETK